MKRHWIIYIAIALLLLSLALYFIFHFWFSSSNEEWASFGSYIGGIGGIILSCSLFYYTYTIDKEHKKMKKNTQVLKLIDVVGESLAYLERWKKLNFNMANESLYDRGSVNHEQMKNERDQLEIKMATNYKTTQVLAKHLYGMEIPNVKELHETEAYFIKVFNSIKI